MPGDQVDAMLAAGPSRATYTPEIAPVLKLLRQVVDGAGKPGGVRDLVVERGDFRLALHAGPSLR